MKKKIKETIEKIENFLFDPHVCVCCDRECDLDNDYRICSRCKDRIPFAKDHYCLKCGETIPESYDYCITCKNAKYNFDYARSIFAYTELTAPIILRFKYNGQRMYAKPLAHLMKDFYDDSDIVSQVVTYVPMPESRQKQRGYNQAYELCREFCELSKLPMLDLLKRKEETQKQSVLNAEERRKNIIGSFVAINKSLIKNKDILLIDDVFTTGSTTSECAKVLKEKGARSVVVFTLAKTYREENLNDKD